MLISTTLGAFYRVIGMDVGLIKIHVESFLL